MGVGKTHSSSLEEDEAEKVRGHALTNGAVCGHAGSSRGAQGVAPKIDLSNVSKPGDVMKAILARKQEDGSRGPQITCGGSARDLRPPRPWLRPTTAQALPAHVLQRRPLRLPHAPNPERSCRRSARRRRSSLRPRCSRHCEQAACRCRSSPRRPQSARRHRATADRGCSARSRRRCEAACRRAPRRAAA